MLTNYIILPFIGTCAISSREGDPGRGGLQGTRPRAGQLGGPASRGLVHVCCRRAMCYIQMTLLIRHNMAAIELHPLDDTKCVMYLRSPCVIGDRNNNGSV
eukprot:1185941-Prorocentrum_minimum.AAC.1